MRNPWRFSFDRGGTGQLYVGDVGQGAREEIDIVTLGGNYGWRVREGTICTNLDPALCNAGGFIDPITEYAHTNGRCSVTGGYVYRGSRGTLPAGTYVYGDFCSGEIFQFPGGSANVLLDTGLSISSFGEDESGEIYVVGASGGTVHRITSELVCTFSVSPTSRSVPVAGVQGAIAAVTAPGGCDWTATATMRAGSPSRRARPAAAMARSSSPLPLTSGAPPSDRDAHHRGPHLHRDPGRLHALGLARPAARFRPGVWQAR